MALATRAVVRSLLGIPAAMTSCNEAIDLLIEAADALVLGEIDLPADEVATYSETLDVEWEGSNDAMLRFGPVVSVVGLTVSGLAYDPSRFYATGGGALRLVDTGASFPAGRQRVEVTYRAGLAAGSRDRQQLTYAANLIAIGMFNQAGHSGFASEKTGAYTYTSDGRALPPVAERILARYRRAFARAY
jgi:hypothetical protein